MEWTDFLKEIAGTYGLSPEQTEAFLIRLDNGNQGKSEPKLARILNISADAFKKRMSGVYEQFAQSCSELAACKNRGKLEKLRAYLTTQYAARSHKPLTYPELNEGRAIQPIPDTINWREVCGNVLAQQREQQRLRRQATERGFELNVYVPLGLVERKQQQRRRGDVPLEQVYQLTEDVITKEYDNDQFLSEVINSGKSKRIAIIGEPGAGKTTLQEKIAVWIQEKNKGLPICISLGGLQGKSLTDYLQQKWLKTALRFIEPDAVDVEARHIASLEKQFREGKVWLLLDGVDEMAATSPMEALATIKEQLTDWLVEARVVLTCRLNVWDANVNPKLAGFEIYKTLEFKPEQVETFIQEWFTKAEESQRGEELLKKLQEPGKERIRELVRNPLRLSLLCQTAYLLPVDEPLPETKAALYQRFTRYFYEWKQDLYPTTRTQRRQLNQALGELAKAGINSKTRFRLGENLACDVMGEPLFDLACRLGWLNLVDRDANRDEPVYAFFHPTFQEYFAACAIDDWHFFLNHDNEKPNPLLDPNPALEYDNGKPAYRIFEPQWKEVILLWLGREDVTKEKKQEFIWVLKEFKDGCNSFYCFQAYFLAAVGIAQFQNCRWADQIVTQLIKWIFGYFDNYKQGWQIFPSPIAQAARIAILESDRQQAISCLTQLLSTHQDEDILLEAAIILVQIQASNCYIIISTLTKLLDSQNKTIRCQAAYRLGLLEPENLKAIETLKDCLNNNQHKLQLSSAAQPTFNPSLSNALEEINRSCIALQLLKLDPKNPDAIKILNKTPDINNNANNLLPDHREPWLRVRFNFYQSADEVSLEIVPVDIDELKLIKVIDGIIKMLHTSQDNLTRGLLIPILGKIGAGNLDVISELIQVLRTSQDLGISVLATWTLMTTLHNQFFPVTLEGLKDCLAVQVKENNLILFWHSYKLIWHCAQNMPYPKFYQAWHQATTHQGEYN